MTGPRNFRTVMIAGLLAGLLIGITSSKAAVAQQMTAQQIEALAKIELPRDPSTVIGVVGTSPILLGDLMPQVEAQLKQAIGQANQQIPQDQLHIARVSMLRGLLSRTIQKKMMAEAFLLKQVGTQAADKRLDAKGKFAAKAREHFFTEQLPVLHKRYGTTTQRELDQKLSQEG